MKFFVDTMLGRLAKVLRILGFDTVYERSRDGLALLVQARNQGRIFVTANRRFRDRPDVFFVAGEKVEEQLAKLVHHFSLTDKIRPFSRCLACNGELIKVTKEEVGDQVPFFTRRTQTDFSRCAGCGRIYWPGSHRQAMEAKLQSLLDVSRETPARPE
jgi:uncharacterized protein with PIN domain